MVPVVHCSGGYSSLVPWTTFLPRKDIQLKKHNVTGRYTGLASSCERLLLPQLSSRLFHIYRSARGLKYGSMTRILAAVGTNVTVEEQNPAVSEDDANGTSDSPNSLETNETAPPTPAPRSKRPRAVRKSEMPLLKDEELVPGASFTGKVRSIQPFGAFVDIGAFTDGLVHVSRLSDGYVKEVGDLVSVGQEVKVRIVEVNKVNGRISLTMRDNDDSGKTQQRNEDISSGSSDKPRPARRNNARPNKKREEVQKSSKFVKGQVLDGTVKNLTRSGAFVALPDGEEGFLPTAEESEGFGNIMGSSSLQAGQEVNVRVLRITRGSVTLTMKKEEDVEGLNKQLSQGVVHVATNPFELAFRRNKDISSFLEEREKAQKASESLSSLTVSPQIGEEADETITKSDILEVDGLTLSSDMKQIDVSSASGSVLEAEKVTSEELHQEASSVDSISTELVSHEEEPASLSGQNAIAALETSAEDEEGSKSLDTSSSISVIDEVIVSDDVKISGAMLETVERRLEESSPGANGSSENLVKDEAFLAYETKEATESTIAVKENEEIPILEESVSKVSITDATRENEELPISEDSVSDASIKENEVQILEDSVSEEISTIDAIEENDVNSVTVEETNSDTQFPEVTVDQILSSEATVPEEVASDQLEVIANETPPVGADEIFSSESLNIQVNAPEISSVQTQTGVPDKGSTTEAAISPALVKQLREETGSGMMDCKKALAETGGDIIKAQEFLRKKGLASADKKSSRATAEGRIGSYIHDNRIGVLIEVNCETDFVSRGEIFKELVDDLSMQVAACPQVRYLATEDVPEDTVNKEREIEMQKEDLMKKPEEIRSKIVDGRIRKRLEEFALLEQPYIKNDKVAVKDFVKQTIATIGENIKVRRFIRYNLGEGLEKKSQDFAAEVAAQTAAKSSPTMPKDQPSEAKETVEKSPTIQVSAVLVKQLREETGAGMMDCKKALTETGGDLEKAQEYLRKKGLSSADKKSSRLAAEGRISSYIHDSRIGVLIEVNSETDFVARNEKFKELVDDLAMQVVACPQVEFVSVDEIPESTVNKEKEIEMQRDDLKSKPEHIREKIVDGRISKRLGELALLEQPFIKDDSILVKDFVKQTVATLGENIKVRRFVRFALGEN